LPSSHRCSHGRSGAERSVRSNQSVGKKTAGLAAPARRLLRASAPIFQDNSDGGNSQLFADVCGMVDIQIRSTIRLQSLVCPVTTNIRRYFCLGDLDGLDTDGRGQQCQALADGFAVGDARGGSDLQAETARADRKA